MKLYHCQQVDSLTGEAGTTRESGFTIHIPNTSSYSIILEDKLFSGCESDG
jgi:hypothetical protein